jgi:hypothetical protein
VEANSQIKVTINLVKAKTAVLSSLKVLVLLNRVPDLLSRVPDLLNKVPVRLNLAKALVLSNRFLI